MRCGAALVRMEILVAMRVNAEPKCGCGVQISIYKHPLRVDPWADTLHETAGCVFVEYQSVGRYSDLLQFEGYEDRILVGARFSAPVQTGFGDPTQPPVQWVPCHSQG